MLWDCGWIHGLGTAGDACYFLIDRRNFFVTYYLGTHCHLGGRACCSSSRAGQGNYISNQQHKKPKKRTGKKEKREISPAC
jgi:hypothetical protein